MSTYLLEKFKILKTEEGNLVFYKVKDNDELILYVYKGSKSYNILTDTESVITEYAQGLTLNSDVLGNRIFDIEVTEVKHEPVCKFKVIGGKEVQSSFIKLTDKESNKDNDSKSTLIFKGPKCFGDLSITQSVVQLSSVKVYRKSDYKDTTTGYYLGGINTSNNIVEARLLDEQATELIKHFKDKTKCTLLFKFLGNSDFCYINEIQLVK